MGKTRGKRRYSVADANKIGKALKAHTEKMEAIVNGQYKDDNEQKERPDTHLASLNLTHEELESAKKRRKEYEDGYLAWHNERQNTSEKSPEAPSPPGLYHV